MIMLPKPFILALSLLLAISSIGSLCAQSCSGCTTTISGYSSANYTVSTGQKLCITTSGQVTGSITLDGGEVCNAGLMLPAAFTVNSGVITNNGTILQQGTLELKNSSTLNNLGNGIVKITGRLLVNPFAAYNSEPTATLLIYPFPLFTVNTAYLDTVLLPDTLMYTITGPGLSPTTKTAGELELFNLEPPAPGQTALVSQSFYLKGQSNQLPLIYDVDHNLAISNVRALLFSTNRVDTVVLDTTYYYLIAPGAGVTGALSGIGINVNFVLDFSDFLYPANKQNYATLARKLDGNYYIAKAGKLNFKYEEEYTGGTLTYKVYDKDKAVVMSNTTHPLATKQFGDNRMSFVIPCNQPNGYYILEVSNDKNEVFVLRFKVDKDYFCQNNQNQMGQ